MEFESETVAVLELPATTRRRGKPANYDKLVDQVGPYVETGKLSQDYRQEDGE